ncbi:MAG TPA: hypothetical protein VL442_12880 [Mucilaginibacter sp.]|jgi:hypothetical protein|nr:hypothetical protein [Mucilaginibacter sp.]
MPFEWSGHIAVSKDELVPTFFSWENLQKILTRYKNKDTGIKRLQLGGNGRQMLIDFDTLPAHIKHALGDPRDEQHPLEKYYRTDKDAMRFFVSYQLEDGKYLKADQQDEYTTNASVLNSIIDLRSDIEKDRRKKGLNTLGIFKTLCDHSISFKKTLKTRHNADHTLPASEKAFKRVLKAFESEGYSSLISGKIGNSNSRKVTDDTMSLLESMFAKDSTKPTATDVFRSYNGFIDGTIEVVNNISGEIYDPADFKPLSPTTVKKYLANWESAIGTHAERSGDRQKYMQKFKPYHSLEKPHYAGSIISVDDRQPPFKMHDGKRIWAYMAIDLASEAFTAWVFGKTKEGIIRDFYQQLVRNYHEFGVYLPDGLEAESSLNSSFKDTFLREGAMFNNVRIEANNARGKRIESWFRPLRYQYEKKREGWLARPFALSESNQQGSHEVPAMYFEDIKDGCLRDIVAWNNAPHSVHKHLSRWEVFMQMQNPDLEPTNYLSILPHLGRKTTTSCNTGIIKFRSAEFLLGENGEVCVHRERLISMLKMVEGKNVDIYWLDGNDGKIIKALIYIDSSLICEAIPKPTYNRAKIEQTDEDRNAREIMSKYVAIIEAYGRERKRAIEPITIIDNRPAPKQTFTIPGLKHLEIIEDSEPEILPQPVDDYNYIPQQTFRKSLKDRF